MNYNFSDLTIDELQTLKAQIEALIAGKTETAKTHHGIKLARYKMGDGTIKIGVTSPDYQLIPIIAGIYIACILIMKYLCN